MNKELNLLFQEWNSKIGCSSPLELYQLSQQAYGAVVVCLSENLPEAELFYPLIHNPPENFPSLPSLYKQVKSNRTAYDRYRAYGAYRALWALNSANLAEKFQVLS